MHKKSIFTSRQASCFDNDSSFTLAGYPLFAAALLVIGLGASSLVLADESNGDSGAAGSSVGDYVAEDGKVDPGTYDGYLVYTRSCQACHGPDGLGSSFAPSLIKISEHRSFEEFARTIAGGQEIQPGQVMPSFADDTYVLSNIENIYSYMRGRSAGDIGRGRPEIIESLQKDTD